MIKVAHVTTLATSLQYLLLNQLQGIQQAGYEVVGISSPGAEVSAIQRAGIRHIPIPITRDPSLVADLISLWRLYRVMRRERFTIAHTHLSKPGLLGQLAAKMAGIPIIVHTVHGFYFHDQMPRSQRRFYVSLEKIAALCSTSILSQNEDDMRIAVEEKICPPEKIRYLGNGIDLRQFDPDRFTDIEITEEKEKLGITANTPVVGFVGRLAAKRKGFLDFLAAGQIVARQVPDVRFLIIGSADKGRPDAVEPQIAATFGLKNHCLFLGQQPNQRLPRLYKIMDMLVLPSLLEGVPRVVMEASAMGIPTIVTNVKGNRDAVEHNRNGLLVPLHNPQTLAKAILELLHDSGKARCMGHAGRRLALERFDERVVFQKIQAEYERLLNEKGLLDQKSQVSTVTGSDLSSFANPDG
ncbi:MAG: glycosyltransferase family 4 protein [Anaerolineae bacterium]|nr:glycosyltransferase family 4 protein [Anaerolineae bacterium]